MIEDNLSSKDKYKNMVVNLDLLKDPYLLEMWEHLQDLGRCKDDNWLRIRGAT
jgi:hypothetical protein